MEDNQLTIDNFYDNEESFLNQTRKRSTIKYDTASSLPSGGLGSSPRKPPVENKQIHQSNDDFEMESRSLPNFYAEKARYSHSVTKLPAHKEVNQNQKVIEEFFRNESNSKLFDSILDRQFDDDDEENESRNKNQSSSDSKRKSIETMAESLSNQNKVEETKPIKKSSDSEFHIEKTRAAPNSAEKLKNQIYESLSEDEEMKAKGEYGRNKTVSIHMKGKKNINSVSFLEGRALPRYRRDPLLEIEEEDLKETKYAGDINELESRLVLKNLLQNETLEVLRCRELEIISEKYVEKEESIGRPRCLLVT